jgi:glucans biosynthesis protein C
LNPENFKDRIHAFDFIRSIAALWGVLFHAGLAYMATSQSPWLLHDSVPGNEFIDLIIWFSHRIRMPLFFIMSGFFASLVLKKRGIQYFIKSRLQKILIPFLISIIFILPLIVELFGTKMGIPLSFPYTGNHFSRIRLAHLWFLYYLFLFSIILTCFNFYQFKNKSILGFKTVNTLLFIVILIFHFLMDSPLSINPTLDFQIDPIAFGFYFTFFVWGSLLNQKGYFEKLRQKRSLFWPALSLIFGLIASFLILGLQKNLLDINKYILISSIHLFTTSYCVLFNFSLLNLGLRFITKKNPIIMYLSDSSYFIYIAHLPVVIYFQRILYQYGFNSISKWSLVTLFSYLTLFAIYHTLIRYSFIGTYLNGPRIRKISALKTTSPSLEKV